MLTRKITSGPYSDAYVEEGKLVHVNRVSQGLLNSTAAARNAAPGRARLGDSHGAYEKYMEIPYSLLLSKLKPGEWLDDKALARIIADPDFAKFRTNNPSRRF